jgi:hypothetical protein
MELASAPGNNSLGLAWNSMYQDVRAALTEGPGSDKAQALANRWMNLVERTTGGDPKIKIGMIRASLDSHNWPAWGQTRVESLKEISAFINKAIDWPLKKYFTEQAWTKRSEHGKQKTPDQLAQLIQARAELFSDIEAALGEDPTGDKAKAVKARWVQIRASEACGDPNILAGSSEAWADRRNWPITIRLREATTYGMTVERFYETAEFLDEIP